MILGYVFFPGMVLALVLALLGINFGAKHPHWFVRLLSLILCLCGFLAMFFVGAEFNPLYFAHPVLNNLIAAAGLCSIGFGGTVFVTSTLASKSPEHNALLPENKDKPSYKRAAWLLVLTAFIIGIPAMMLGIVLYHGEFVAGHIFLVVVPTIFSGLTISQARAELRPNASKSEPPKWVLVGLVLLLVAVLLACFKGWGLLCIFLVPFVLLGSGSARS